MSSYTRSIFCPLLFLLSVFSTSLMPSLHAEEWDLYLPQGEGKELLGSLCTSCHNLQRIVTQRKDRDFWQQTVHAMLPPEQIEYIPDELEIVVDYLAKYLGPLIPTHEELQNNLDLRASYTRGEVESIININTALPSQLLRLPGITTDLAEQIINYRSVYGKFTSIAELKKIKTIDNTIFEKLKELITTH